MKRAFIEVEFKDKNLTYQNSTVGEVKKKKYNFLITIEGITFFKSNDSEFSLEQAKKIINLAKNILR